MPRRGCRIPNSSYVNYSDLYVKQTYSIFHGNVETYDHDFYVM